MSSRCARCTLSFCWNLQLQPKRNWPVRQKKRGQRERRVSLSRPCRRGRLRTECDSGEEIFLTRGYACSVQTGRGLEIRSFFHRDINHPFYGYQEWRQDENTASCALETRDCGPGKVVPEAWVQLTLQNEDAVLPWPPRGGSACVKVCVLPDSPGSRGGREVEQVTAFVGRLLCTFRSLQGNPWRPLRSPQAAFLAALHPGGSCAPPGTGTGITPGSSSQRKHAGSENNALRSDSH